MGLALIVVKIKMLKDFVDESRLDSCSHPIVLLKGETYFAIDAGDYWIVQACSGTEFCWVVPKEYEPVVAPTAYAKEVE